MNGRTDAQRALLDAAAPLLERAGDPHRLAQLEAEGPWIDHETWDGLAAAGVLEGLVGTGSDPDLGSVAVHDVLERAGRTVAHVPLLETIVLGTAPAVRFGDGSHAELVAAVGAGGCVTTAALAAHAGVPGAPLITATRTGEGWHLDGREEIVPALGAADQVVVAAVTAAGPLAFIVPTSATGVHIEVSPMLDATPDGALTLDRVVVDANHLVGGEEQGAEVVTWTTTRARAGVAAMQSGVCAGALRLAASYTSERRQFGRRIATFQAVAHRLADAAIQADIGALTAHAAALALDADPGVEDGDTRRVVDVAAWWAAEAAHVVLHTAQHVHGGVGVDLSYPLHRYYRRGKRLEFLLGGAAAASGRLGRLLSASPAPQAM